MQCEACHLKGGNGTDLGLEAYSDLTVDESNERLLMGNGFISLTADNVDEYHF